MTKNIEMHHPVPQGKYVPSTRFGQMIYTAGMTPRRDGILIQSGKVTADKPVHVFKEAVEQAARNALTAASNTLTEGESIAQILTLNVYINAEEGFESHSRIADFASEYLYEQLGEAAIGSRAAIGVASLPGDAPVEIQLTAFVLKK